MLQYSVHSASPPPLSSNHFIHHDFQQLKLDSRPFSLTSSPLAVSTNFSLLPSPPTSPRLSPTSPYLASRRPTDSSPAPSVLEGVLFPGDVVGQGLLLQGEPIRQVSIGLDSFEPPREFEVVRQLGTGSYAVVYLVREVLSRPPISEDGHTSIVGSLDFDGKPPPPQTIEYGTEYAIKCLSKANLDEEALAAQLSEVTIHQSLPTHPNIVTLHRTFETTSYLLLLLEFVPGEDLFYFLEQSRDHYEADCPDSCLSSSHTPPTPSLLSTLHPDQLLSRTRLRLVASMFSQMCDAVAECHAHNVYHRDIKPENFIVTDGFSTTPDGRQERKVIVKLTDFGLSTREEESADMDCGSAPYMSYECRNNVAPTYRPRAADIWSLGVVLINMLYHSNPWLDAAEEGGCSSFDLFRQQPVPFFMQRFHGMTRPVAEFLATHVFCILDDPEDDSARISAQELGTWARDLPALLGPPEWSRTVPLRSASPVRQFPASNSHPVSYTVRTSHRPSSRNPSRSGTPMTRTPAIPHRTLSRPPSRGPHAMLELSTVIDQEELEQEVGLEQYDVQQERLEIDYDLDIDSSSMNSRSTSAQRKRKRGARKGKGSISSSAAPSVSVSSSSKAALTTSPPQSSTPHGDTLLNAVSALVRDLSKQSSASSGSASRRVNGGSTSSAKSSSVSSRSRNRATPDKYTEPLGLFAVPVPLLTTNSPLKSPLTPRSPRPQPPASPVTKKPSKWKLTLRRNSVSTPPTSVSPSSLQTEETSKGLPNPSPALVPPAPPASVPTTGVPANKVANVSGLIMGLNAPPPKYQDTVRGRSADNPPPNGSPFTGTPIKEVRVPRNGSPSSARSAWPSLASSGSSTYSSNWRSSMGGHNSFSSSYSSNSSSAGAFTRYSNSSRMSVSTVATSVSAGSWRNQNKSTPSSLAASPGSRSFALSPPETRSSSPPKTTKYGDAVPWAVDEFPRQLNMTPPPDTFETSTSMSPAATATATIRKARNRSGNLEPITENKMSPLPYMGNETEFSGVVNDESTGEPWSPKKVQKGQINALAKMLFALRRSEKSA